MTHLEALIYFIETPAALWSELCPSEPEQEDVCTVNDKQEAWDLGYSDACVFGCAEPARGWELEPADNDPNHYNAYLDGFRTGQAIRSLSQAAA